MTLSIGISISIDRSFGGGAGGLSAPTLNPPSPLATNPTTIVAHVGVDWQTGDVFNLARSANVNMSSPTVLTHTITDADITAGTFSIGLSTTTLSGITYFDAYGTHSGVQSPNVSNIVTWGDTVAPTITTAATASVVETLPLAVTLAATDTGGVPAQLSDGTKPGWCITGGADQLQFQIAIVTGTPTLQWYNNGSQSYSSPKNYPPNSANPYNVQVTAVDYGGNKSTLNEAVTVSQANLTPTGFAGWTNVSNATLSTLYTAVDTWTVAGMSAGVNASLSATGPIRVSLDNGVTWTAWGSPPSTVQNGAQIQAQDSSSGSYSTGTSNAVTVGTVTKTFTVTTQADPNAAGFTPSTNQPAYANVGYSGAVATFNGVDFVAGGYGVVFVCENGDTQAISSIVIKGAGASGADISLVQRVIQTSGTPMQVWTAPATIVAGASQQVVVTFAGAVSLAAIVCGTVTNTSSPVPTASAVTNFASNASPVTTGAVSIPAAGVGACFWNMNSATPYTTSSGTLLYSGSNGQNYNAVTRRLTAGSWTPSLSYTGGQAANGAIACVWSH